MKARAARYLIPLQGATAMLALVAFTMWPPSSGAMLLVPLASGSLDSVAKIALAGGATLLGAGPLPGSLVVVGNRSRIFQQIRAWDVVLMAAPPAGCGNRVATGAAA